MSTSRLRSPRARRSSARQRVPPQKLGAIPLGPRLVAPVAAPPLEAHAGLASSCYLLRMSHPFALAVHGGAGAIERRHLSPELEREYRDKLEEALRAGHDVLQQGGASVDAVVEAVVVLEDARLFNAGVGSVLTSEGRVEMEAAVMSGQNLAAGAAFLLRTVKNPVRLARALMDQRRHVMLGGPTAEAFARTQGLAQEPESYFITERRRAALSAVQASAKEETLLSESEGPVQEKTEMPDAGLGTVGAVALDQAGNLAAATSTGGLTNKWPGRIGDSPVIGAGTYADNRGCAVSTTGHGEMFLRISAAQQMCARMRFGGASLQEAAHAVILEELSAVGGMGGLIAIDRNGKIACSLNTSGMYRGAIDVDGRLTTAIFAE